MVIVSSNVIIVHHRLRATESVEALVSVPNERQTHFCREFVALRRSLCAQCGAVVSLRDLVDGKVLGVDVAQKFGLEGRTNTAETVPLHAVEEGVLLEFLGATEGT